MTSAPMSLPNKSYAMRVKALGMLLGGIMLAFNTPVAQARDLFKQDAFANYKPDLKNGEYMMNAAGCAACHASTEDAKLLSGGLKMDTFIGTFFVPNISADAAGIGGWSNADFLNAIMNGIGKDGQHLYPVMPYTSYAGMKPEDVIDIKAYIDTLAKSDNKVAAHELSFPYNLSATIAFWKRGNFDTAAFQPDDGSQNSRGRYLVENVGACGECHTPRSMDFGLDKTRAYEGEKGLTGSVAPPITKSRLDGISADAFVKGVLVDGMKLGGSPISDPVMKRYAEGTAKLGDEDRRAMLAFLTGDEVAAPKIEATAEAACKDSSAELTLASAGDKSLAPAADEFVGKYCRNCHGPGESAQGSFPSGDLASIGANAAFVTPGDKTKSLLYTSVASGRMPYGKRPSGAELQSLGDWIDSLDDAPSAGGAAAASKAERQRPVISWRDHAEAAVTDLSNLNEGDRAFIRYFSFRNEYNGKLPCEAEDAFVKRLELYKAGFAKLVNSVSLGASLVVPQVVADTKDLLVRVDIRDLGWDNDKWDKLLASYPFGYDPDSDSLLKTLATDTDTNVPIMRADWFVANAAKPANYHALLELPENIADLEKRIDVDVNDNIQRRRVIRSAIEEGASGVSDHNRMLERHDTPNGGYYWKSYDFAASDGDQNLKRHPHGPVDVEPLDEDLTAFKHDGGEMIFSLPNGLQGYYLSTAKGDRIERGPASIVSYRNRPIGKGVEIVNGRSCMDCHADGIIAKLDQMRDFVKASPTFSIEQRDLLLEMYVEQGDLDKAFASDRAKFVAALEKIGVTEASPDGGLKSRSGPNKEEIFTWFADIYEDDLDRDALAAEFDLTPEEFEQAIQRVKDGDALRIGLDWITQLKGGSSVPRFEVEQQFAALVEPLMGLEPLKIENGEGASTNETKTPDYKDADYREDGVKADDKKGNKLALSVDVKNTDVFVDEKLSFKVEANNKCELQIFYVESDGNVEEIPQSMIGEAFLEAGKPRAIPDPASGDLVFDAVGADETMLLFCREGGLGNQRLNAKGAKKLAKSSGEATSRGIAIKLFEKAKADEKKADANNEATGGKGTSAIHLVTFNVKARS